MALSDLTVRQARTTGKRYTLSDNDCLGLMVSAAGGKSWMFRYYWLGKQKRMSLGGYPALSLREARAAHAAGAFTIVRVHVLGNVLGPIFVYATSLIAVSMILASGLSFLGLGVKPPEPEWGLMLNTLRTAIYTQPWVAALPGVMIFITSIAFNLLSDGLRSAMDIKQ